MKSRGLALLVALSAGCSATPKATVDAGAPPPAPTGGDTGSDAAPVLARDAAKETGEASAPATPGSHAVEETFVGAYAGLIRFRRVLSVGSLGAMPVLVAIYATMT